MTLSLDTHVFLWWLDDPQLLSKAARKAIGDGKHTVYVSAAAVWEITIRWEIGGNWGEIGVSSFFLTSAVALP
jgi:PIN domain nuclease of toxin-antitoxin system